MPIFCLGILAVLALAKRKERALVLGSGVPSWDGGGRGSTEQWALSLLSVPSVPSGPLLVSHLGEEGTSWAAREKCN